MAFDFAECWNTKKSIVFNLPPPGYDVEVDGPWMGRNLVPLVALAGDALLEPFWPMGLGLKRGWQAVMDTCYAVDNLYNREKYATRMGKDPTTFSWEDHCEAHQAQVSQNFEFCNRLKISDELAKGEYDPKGVVLLQLLKKVKDAERPVFEVEVDPWTRYEPLMKELGDSWKTMSKDDAWVHSRVQKSLNMAAFYAEVGKGGKNGEITYEGKPLLSINGKVLPGCKGTGSLLGTASKPAPAPAPGAKLAAVPQGGGYVNPLEMQQLAKERQQAMAAMVQARPQASAPAPAPAPEVTSSWRPSVGSVAPPKSGGVGGLPCGIAAAAAAAANVMKATPVVAPMPVSTVVPGGLSPAEEAELFHVRNMIQTLQSSLAAFQKAEQEILSRAAGR